MSAPEGLTGDDRLAALEHRVAVDPGDDEARRAFVEAAAAAGAELRAAEAMKAAIRREKSSEVRERVGLEIATLYLKEGELGPARHAFLEVVVAGAGGPAALAASRKVLELEGEPGDPHVLAAALEIIARKSAEPAERHAAAARLLVLHATAPLKDARIASAYIALLDSPRAGEAVAWLKAFVDRGGDAGDLARHAIEGCLAHPEAAAGAASILEPIYLREGAVEGMLHVLEARARDATDVAARLAILSTAIELSAASGLRERAAGFCRHALNADPSSPELHQRYDDLVKGDESFADRLGRYEAALTRAEDPARRGALLRTVAALRDAAGDTAGAIEAWRAIVAIDPSDSRVHAELITAASRAGDEQHVVALIDAARDVLEGGARASMTMRKVSWLAVHEQRGAALALASELLEEPLELAQIEAIAEFARDQDDPDLRRRALERIGAVGDATSRARALEQVGEIQLEQLGDRRAAASSWRAAAAAVGDVERERARQLYERALDALPDDRDAAERLVELYARDSTAPGGEPGVGTDAWARLPQVLRPLAEGGDPEVAAAHLLRFQGSALEARATEEFVGLVDALLPRLADESPSAIPLRRARAAALAADPACAAPASEALRALVDEVGAPEDVHALEVFVESRPSSDERHLERRWLWQWRAAHHEQPARVLLEWARAEEEYGEPGLALEAYERLLAADPRQRDALEAVCRARFRGGEERDALSAFDRLVEETPAAERGTLSVRMAEWLWSDLGRASEAASVLAPALATRPAAPGAEDVARGMLGDPAVAGDVAERLEAAAARSPEATFAIATFLLSAREETEALSDARVRWYTQALSAPQVPDEEAFALAARGALECPDTAALWDALERYGRVLGRAADVARTYHEIFSKESLSSEVANALGRRMVAFEDDCAVASEASIEALLSVLDSAPEARWALDRVKLRLGAQARWEELFALYDRTIAAAPLDAERVELLHEAAAAAKDLAGEPRRATAYFELLRSLRPDDSIADAALERLYERQGQRLELIALLERRAADASGFKLRELRRRIVTLWLDLGDTESASDALDRTFEGGARVAEVVDLLERVARPADPASEGARAAALRAIERLTAHYGEAGREEDRTRVAEQAIDLAEGGVEQSARVREWAAFVLSECEKAGREPFASTLERVTARLASEPSLAAIGTKWLLVRSLRAWRRARETDRAQPRTADGAAAEGVAAPPKARGEAEDGAFAAVEALATSLVQNGRGDEGFRLLYRAGRLPFERKKRRDLLCTAAFVCADVVGAIDRAVQVLDELFDDDPGDDVASAAMQRFAELLDTAGEYEKLAARWEEQAALRTKAGAIEAARSQWERAGELWERQGRADRAVAAYRQGAALESPWSYEALARIHGERTEWADAARALEWLYARAGGTERAARALELAKAYDALGDRDRARSRLESVLSSSVDTEEGEDVREQLLDLYRRDRVFRPLATLLGVEAARAPDPARKVGLAREACEILVNDLRQPAEAATLLEQAVQWAPRDEELRQWLADILESLSRWDDAARVLRGHVELFGDQRSKDRAAVHHRRARVLVRAGRSREALDELRAASEMLPGHVAVMHDLGRVAIEVGEVELSEATYRALLLALPRSAAGAGELRPAVYLDLGEIALRRGDAERAADLTDSAFDEALEAGDTVADGLAAKLAARGRHELLAREEERCTERATTLAQRARALGQWVQGWSDHLGRSADVAARIRDHAARMARDIEHDRLTDAEAWAALAAVQRAAGDADTRDRLVAALRASAQAVEAAADRARLRASLARMLLADPARPDAAIAAWKEALEDDPSSREAAEGLSDALEREGLLDELIAMLEKTLRGLSPEREAIQVAGATWRLGLALERADRRPEALALYESLLEREGLNGELLSSLSTRLSELGSARLGDCLERWLALEPRSAPAIAPRLAALRDASGDRAGAVRALEASFAVEPSDAAIRDRLVDHYEHESAWARAAAALRRSIDASPDDRALVKRWIAAAERAGETEDLARVIDAALARRADDTELLLLRAASREKAGDVDGAVADLESACAADSRLLPSLVDLLLRVVSPEAPRSSPPAEGHVLRLSDLLVRYGRPKEARVYLEALHARSPRRRDVLRKMALAASAERDWLGAGGAYLEIIQLADKEGARDEVTRTVPAMIAAYERAGKPDEARAALRPTLEAWASRGDASPELERLCEAAGDYDRLASALGRRAEAESDPNEKLSLWTRAAQLLLEHGGSAEASLALVERARALAPDEVDVAVLWARAQVARGRTPEALAALMAAAEQSRAHRTQLAIIELEIAKAHLAADEVVEAFEALKSAFAADWRTGDVAMLLGLVALDLEDDKTAERAFVAVTTAAPRKDGTDAQAKALAFYHLAAIAFHRGDVAKAKLLATKAVGGDAAQLAARGLLEKLAR